uniref:Uncharacterized protein n=1 Tax=Avena sativa TaxID=4498 RepID=A0ACD5U5L3_AVESA
MSSSSSSGASATAAFTPVSQQQQQQQQQMAAAEHLSSALQLPAPVQEEAPSDTEQLCYVHCHICDTVLVVSVPSSSLFKTVTVRCGHCSSLLTVDMRGLLVPTTTTTTATMSANSAVTTTTTTTSPPPPPAAHHGQFQYPSSLNILPPRHSLLDEISSANPSLQLLEQHGLGGLIAAAGGRNATAPAVPPPLPPPASVGKGGKEPSPRTNSVVNRPPEKRQRVPSAYNRFIKDEIQRIKAGNPDISHREAFSAAAKNWAHFPHIHFGLMPDHQGIRKTTLLPQDHQRKDGHGLLKDGLYAAAAAANMGVAPY